MQNLSEGNDMNNEGEKGLLIERIVELETKLFQALRPMVPEAWLKLDYTLAQLKILLLLFVDGPTKMGALAAAIGVSLGTTTGIVDRLVKRGMVIRKNDPNDRRAIICRISAKGRDLVAGLWDLGQTRIRTILEDMTPPDLRLINNSMEVVIKTIEP